MATNPKSRYRKKSLNDINTQMQRIEKMARKRQRQDGAKADSQGYSMHATNDRSRQTNALLRRAIFASDIMKKRISKMRSYQKNRSDYATKGKDAIQKANNMKYSRSTRLGITTG